MFTWILATTCEMAMVMRGMCSLMLLLTVLQGIECWVSKCVERKQKIFLNCPTDHVIYKVPIYLGASATDTCLYQDGDCTGLSIALEDMGKACLWKPSCKLQWSNSAPLVVSQNNSCHTVKPSYVMYKNPICIHKDKILDITMDNAPNEVSEGVLRSSLHYPYHYKNIMTRHNEFILKARAGYVLVLLLDDLRTAGQDSLRISIRGGDITKEDFYDRTANHLSFEIAEEDVHIIFTLRDMDKDERGFILRFEYKEDRSNRIKVKSFVKEVKEISTSTSLSVKGSVDTCIARRDAMAINCPDDHVIFNPDVTTGVSNARSCMAHPGDCQGLTHTLITQVNRCYWKGHCDLTWTRGIPLTMTSTLNCLAQIPNYISFKGYQCIPKQKVFDICDDATFINTTDGIIRSHYNYPWHYQTKHRTCRKYIPINPNTGMRIYTVDVDLDPGSNGDAVKFFADKRKRLIKKLMAGQRADIHRASGCLMIEFRVSRLSKGGGGFILKFEPLRNSHAVPQQHLKDSCGTMVKHKKPRKKQRKRKKTDCGNRGDCVANTVIDTVETRHSVLLNDDGRRLGRKLKRRRKNRERRKDRPRKRKRGRKERKRQRRRKRKNKRKGKKNTRRKYRNMLG